MFLRQRRKKKLILQDRIAPEKDTMTDWLTRRSLDLAATEGFDVEKKNNPPAFLRLFVQAGPKKHTEVIIMINQLASVLILDGLQHEGATTPHMLQEYKCWKPRLCQKWAVELTNTSQYTNKW